MYKPTGFVPEISLPAFIYSSHWAGGILSHDIHKPDIFTFYSLAPTSNQDKEVENFGPTREYEKFSLISILRMLNY